MDTNDYLDTIGAQLAASVERGAHRGRWRRATGSVDGVLGYPGRLALRTVALAAPLAVVAIVIAVALTIHSSVHSISSTRPPTADAQTGVAPELLRNFKILRRARRPGDQLPSAYRNSPFARRLTSRGFPVAPGRRPAGFALLPSLSRAAVIPGTRIEEWIEPGRRGYCLFVAERDPSATINTGGFGASCSPLRLPNAPQPQIMLAGASLAPGPPLQPLTPGEPSLATGIAPDRVQAIELVTRAGTTTRVPLTEGFFATRLASTDRLYAIIAGHRQLLAGAAPAATTTTPPSVSGTVVAQINLTPPGAATTAGPRGTAKILQQGLLTTGVAIIAQHVPPTPTRSSYAVWLFASTAHSKLLGFVNPGPNARGELHTTGELPADASSYSTILLTIETRAAPPVPGKIVLRGALALG